MKSITFHQQIIHQWLTALAIFIALSFAVVSAQTPAITSLIARAHAQEQAGRNDLAVQTWQQILLIHPKDQDALLGLARAAKLEGHDADAKRYLDMLHQLDPNDSRILAGISSVEHTASTQAQTAQLQHAAQLAKQRKPDEALHAYRDIWGQHPPDGDWALAYYDTKASIEANRADAVTNLRTLAKKYPADKRYSITLGRILTYTPRTRPEGVRILKEFAQDTNAQQALRQALEWDAKNPSAAPVIASFLKQHPDVELEHALVADKAKAAEQHHEHADNDLSAEQTTELWANVEHGTAALAANSTDDAIAAYKAALAIRPNTVEALNGLAGSYQKANQPAQAIPVYRQIIKLQPNSAEAWRGLFDAQLQADQVTAAIETARQLPATIKSQLLRDPAYLHSLATAYRAAGQTTEAEATLDKALSMPFPKDGRNLKTDTRLQYAALLAEGRRFAQAAGLYRDVLYDDPENLPAWQGLINVQHQAGHDAEALATADRMSPASYEAALVDSGFLSMLAGIYQQQNRLDTATDLLQRSARTYAAQNRPAPLPLQLQLAAIYLQQNHPEPAYTLFRNAIAAQPQNPTAWKGLIDALHQSHRDTDALAELRQLPTTVRRTLDRDVAYNQTVAAIYAATGNAPAALQLIAQIQQFYRTQHTVTPPDIDIQNVWLLYNTHDDPDLYRALMALGDREDLSDPQRLSVQSLWATWSVRRAGEAVDAGNQKRSLEILNVAAQAFPGNPEVSKALAGGYLKAGDARTAMAIYTSLNLSNASAADYQGMVGTALAIPNLHQAELWLRAALDRYKNDSQILALAARFEQARGDHARSAQYWKASLAAAPTVDPANRLAHTLDRADPQPPRATTKASLSLLLDPEGEIAPHAQRPSLPGYHNSAAASSVDNTSASALYGPDPYSLGTAPVPSSTVTSHTSATTRSNLTGERLRDYVPQSDLLPLTASPRPDASPVELADAFAPPDLLRPADSNTNPSTAADATQPFQPTVRYLENATPTLSANTHPTPEPPPPYITEPSAPYMLQPSSKPVLAAFAPPLLVPLNEQLRAVSDPASFALAPPQSSPFFSQSGPMDLEPQQQDLPPLRGPWSAQTLSRATTAPNPHDLAEQQIDSIAAGYSPWNGGSGYVSHRSGTPGFDELYILESPFESSTVVGTAARLTAIVTPAFLASGASDGTSTTFLLGTLAASVIPAQQNASGVGGELQLSTSSIGLSVGTTPRGFLVSNITGRFELHPPSSPIKLTFVREAVKDSQLSYSGLNDPGTATLTTPGNTWGGVIANSGNLQFGRGDAKSGYYAGLGGQYITGLNVSTNSRYDGVAGAYWKLFDVPQTASLTLGTNFFGMHYDQNLRYFTYGQGGYFSPDIYFLASLPLTLAGQYGPNLHYSISGALGLQAFQENTSFYFPLSAPSNKGLLTHAGGNLVLPALPITPIVNNPSYSGQSVVGSNYDIHAEVSAHLVDRWYVGGFVSLNNTRNYASQTAGFFLRYMGRPASNDEHAPTGLFPATGQRPLMVP